MNENAKKWVEALRSGEFKQTRHVLSDEKGFCCLGVGAAIYERETGAELPKVDGFYSDTALDGDFQCVCDWLGLQDSEGRFTEFGSLRFLSRKNDHGASFTEIADIIESEPQGLFE